MGRLGRLAAEGKEKAGGKRRESVKERG